MTRAEENVQTTARLYECRKAARSILGDAYDTALQPWREVIAAHMTRTRRSVLQAVTDLGQRIYNDADGVALMLLMAAAVETIEQPQAVPVGATPPAEGAPVSAPPLVDPL